MKKLLLIIGLFYGFFSYSQAVPTLGVGLEALTLNKGTIDVEVLTKIIMEKQKELKNEALKRFMFKMFPETNYTTRYYVQNCLNILLNEKNPQVIEKEILELTTNYAIALGVTKALEKLNNEAFNYNYNVDKPADKQTDKPVINNNLPDKKTKVVSFDIRIDSLRNAKYKSDRIEDLKNEICSTKTNLNSAIKTSKFHKSKRLNKQLKRRNSRLALLKMKNEIVSDVGKKDDIPNHNNFTFGLKLDLVSLSLSENKLIGKKGFFKNKIDFREEGFINESKSLDADKVLKISRNIDSLINPYIENYEFIEAFLKNSNLKKTDNISEELNSIYLNQLNLSDSFILQVDEISSSNPDLEKIKIEAKILKKVLTVKDNIEYLQKLNIDNLKIFALDYSNTSFEVLYLEIKEAIKFINPAIKKYNEIVSISKDLQITSSKINLNDVTTIDEPKYYLKNEPNTQKKTVKDNNVNSKEELILEIKTLEQKLEILSISVSDTVTKDKTLISNEITENNRKIIENNRKINEINNNYIKELARSIKKFDSIKNSLRINIDDLLKKSKNNISKSGVFFDLFLKEMIESVETQNLNRQDLNLLKLEEKAKIVSAFGDLYEKLNYLKDNKNITLEDINFLEKDILKRIFEAKLLDGNNDKISAYYDTIINNIKNITPLLKIKIIADKKLNFKYSEDIISLFEFIGNLNKLNKADTYTSIIDLLRENSEVIIEDLPEGKFKEGYRIFVNGMKKYTLINADAENEYIKIDIVSFLNDLQQYYNRNNPSQFSLYLSMGLNQNLFIDDFTFPDSSEKINSIGFASEKIGVKYKLLDFKKYRGYENVIKSDVYLNKRSPFINEWYVMTYGSGLLYSLANTSTNQNFNFAHVGFGTGIRFYNSLDLNLTLGLPFVKNENFGNNGFIGLGLDIPLGEYLEGLGNK